MFLWGIFQPTNPLVLHFHDFKTLHAARVEPVDSLRIWNGLPRHHWSVCGRYNRVGGDTDNETQIDSE
jgi:hypothetical protein